MVTIAWPPAKLSPAIEILRLIHPALRSRMNFAQNDNERARTRWQETIPTSTTVCTFRSDRGHGGCAFQRERFESAMTE